MRRDKEVRGLCHSLGSRSGRASVIAPISLANVDSPRILFNISRRNRDSRIPFRREIE
jgi:hypothetical protein